MTDPNGRTLLRSQRIVDADGDAGEGWLLMEGDTIVGRGDGAPPPEVRASAVHRTVDAVMPGLIDMHVHGALGADFSSVGVDPQPAIAYHQSAGSTTIVASLATGTPETTERRVRELLPFVASGALVGLHLEGPWLSPRRRGAHAEALLRSPEPGELRGLLDAGEGSVRMVTVAPELPGAMDAIRLLVTEGVTAAIGHTDADAETTERAIDAGASVVTHLFNGMPSLHHRDPGVVGVALARDAVIVELIADGTHIDDRVVDVVLRAARGRVVLISDAMSATGLCDGSYEVAGSRVTVQGGTARVADGGSLAGSTHTLGAIVRRLAGRGVPRDVLVDAACTQPAKILGIPTPRLRPGQAADLVAHCDGASSTMKGGRWLDT